MGGGVDGCVLGNADDVGTRAHRRVVGGEKIPPGRDHSGGVLLEACEIVDLRPLLAFEPAYAVRMKGGRGDEVFGYLRAFADDHAWHAGADVFQTHADALQPRIVGDVQLEVVPAFRDVIGDGEGAAAADGVDLRQGFYQSDIEDGPAVGEDRAFGVGADGEGVLVRDGILDGDKNRVTGRRLAAWPPTQP